MRTQNTPTLRSNTPPKMGFLRCDSRGIYVTGTYPRSGSMEQPTFHVSTIYSTLSGEQSIINIGNVVLFPANLQTNPMSPVGSWKNKGNILTFT
jgi:hypothetical protein